MLGEIISKKHQFTLADMEAGLEHLSRSDGTLRHVDILLVMLEPYQKALETARRTKTVAEQLGLPGIFGLGNKVQGPEDDRFLTEFADSIGLPILAQVPFDESVRQADRRGVALIDFAPDSPAVEATAQLLDSVERAWLRTAAVPN